MGECKNDKNVEQILAGDLAKALLEVEREAE